MSLFKRTKPAEEEKPLTKEEAQKIYNYFEAGIDETKMFTEKGVSFKESKTVLVEIRRLEAEVNLKASGKYVITPEIPEVRDENDKVIQKFVPVVYYIPTTEKALASSLESELLDTAILTRHIREYSDGNPDAAPDWKTWLESFKKEM